MSQIESAKFFNILCTDFREKWVLDLDMVKYVTFLLVI